LNCIIGLDLAEKTGICVLSDVDHRLIWSKSVKLAQRDRGMELLTLRKILKEILEKFRPGEMAVEDVFLPVRTSRRTPIMLGELRGVARLCAAEAQIPVFFYAPAKIKLAITGSGRAAKEDVVKMIEAEFKIKIQDHNEADAISVAYTHWLSKNFNRVVESASASKNANS